MKLLHVIIWDVGKLLKQIQAEANKVYTSLLHLQPPRDSEFLQ